ncbi:MAG: phage tail tape measure protein, partial [Natronohydrobacter sp.]|nr:phage tail tape measure protein [Natronohydrobacter sp.]
MSASDAFVNALDRIAARLADLAADQFLQMLLGGGGGGGGWLSKIFGGSGGTSGAASPSLPRGVVPNALGDVVGAPTLFAYGDRPGQLGVMGEAGPEAIMPLTHAMGMGVGAMFEGRETTLPLTRLASGKLGVELPANLNIRPFAKGAAFGHVPAPPPSTYAGRARDADAAPVLHMPVNVHNYSGQPVSTRDEPDGRGGRQMTMVIGEATAAALRQPGNPARRTLE